MLESEIFHVARKLPLIERDAYLISACQGNTLLRREIEQLLHAHHLYDIARSHAPGSSDTDTCVDSPYTQLTHGSIFENKYRIDKLLGEGGMGAVFLAEQLEPVQRQVAIKIIRGQIALPSLVARFELEQRALALMNHPGIAKVHDAGITRQGSPYFVMEYIQGETLNRFLKSTESSLRNRLAIMIQICQAIHHAHQKGVIHRDLKPSNILVSMVDGKPVPRIIDFGTVKTLEDKNLNPLVQTEFGALVGTPEYMSPEQSAFGTDIDTRSDMYSLGIILYEMLTDTVPFPRAEFAVTGLSSMLQAIRQREPAKPSLAVMKYDSLSGSANSSRSSIIRGDLDSIVMKTLEKDRERRYASAEALAQDLMRYLADEPVLARPASATYRLKKFVVKNRGTVLASSLVVLALLTGLTGTTWAMLKSDENAKAALEAETIAIKRLEQVEKEKQKTEKQIELSNAIIDFFLLDVFRQADPVWLRARGQKVTPQITLSDAIQNASKAIYGKFQDNPYQAAIIHRTAGRSLIKVGEHRQAVAHFKRAVELFETSPEAEPSQILLFKSELADVLVRVGNYREALTLLPGILQEEERLLGEYEKQTLDSLHRLAAAHTSMGHYAQAKALWGKLVERRIRKYGDNHEQVLTSRAELAYVLARTGNIPDAIKLLEPDYELAIKNLDPDHHITMHVSRILALCYNAQGDTAKALPMYEKLDQLFTNLHGKDHPETLINHIHRGNCLRKCQRNAEAVQLLEPALKAIAQKFGENHEYTLMCTHYLGAACLAEGQDAKALSFLEKAYDSRRKRSGDQNLDTLSIIPDLSLAYQIAKLPVKAVPLCERYYQFWLSKEGKDSNNTKRALLAFAMAFQRAGDFVNATTLLEPWVDQFKLEIISKDNDQLNLVISYLHGLERLSKPEKAEPFRRKIADETLKVRPDQHHIEISRLAHNLNLQKKFSEAEPLIMECFKVKRNESKSIDLEYVSMRCIHAATLTGLKQYEQADHILQQNWKTMKQFKVQGVQKVSHREVQGELIRAFINLYQNWSKPEEVKRWKDVDMSLSKP